ncbi:hypothetical protein [Rhizobium mayense]|uniref:Uncharacterized protein n=1 Tax=Rhizobium mayense TaxID=1312184 RepID=A0ABT7JVF4_9HYPH|nr:hypothetical protein [Rhizobium mayense]MDL2400329.1 hypothetical protein [Rhizobium mayense]
MFLLRIDLTSFQLLDEICVQFGNEAAFHEVQHVHLCEDGGDQAVDFEGSRLVTRCLADHHLLHQ